jgi:hypothetical protein
VVIVYQLDAVNLDHIVWGLLMDRMRQLKLSILKGTEAFQLKIYA